MVELNFYTWNRIKSGKLTIYVLMASDWTGLADDGGGDGICLRECSVYCEWAPFNVEIVLSFKTLHNEMETNSRLFQHEKRTSPQHTWSLNWPTVDGAIDCERIFMHCNEPTYYLWNVLVALLDRCWPLAELSWTRNGQQNEMSVCLVESAAGHVCRRRFQNVESAKRLFILYSNHRSTPFKR